MPKPEKDKIPVTLVSGPCVNFAHLPHSAAHMFA